MGVRYKEKVTALGNRQCATIKQLEPAGFFHDLIYETSPITRSPDPL